MDVCTSGHPLFQGMHGKSVSEVMETGPVSASSVRYPCRIENDSEPVVHNLFVILPSDRIYEEWRIGCLYLSQWSLRFLLLILFQHIQHGRR